MNILIVDNNFENLEAARKATLEHREHNFFFTVSARGGIEMLSDVDAVITGLFFPNERHEYIGELNKAYFYYQAGMKHTRAWNDVVKGCYNDEFERAKEKWDDAMAFTFDGTIRRAVEGIIMKLNWRVWGKTQKQLKHCRRRLQKLPAPQFPYGGGIMLRAKELKKRHCLLTNIHSHAYGCPYASKDALAVLDGIMLLLPLIRGNQEEREHRGTISVEEAKMDGEGSLIYMGRDQVAKSGPGKHDPAVWVEAIRRILAQ